MAVPIARNRVALPQGMEVCSHREAEVFRDRAEAGERLARRLTTLGWEADLVLGVPRGGVIVAAPVAASMAAPLNVAVVRKIGHPAHPEFGLGAVAEDGSYWLDPEWAERCGLAGDRLDQILLRLRSEIEAVAARYRRVVPPPRLEGRSVVVVDDGAATGGTLVAVCRALRATGPARLGIALPVASDSAVEALQRVADDLEVLIVPPNFRAVGEWYDRFGQTSEEEVVACLEAASSSL
ncbi:MAG: phosphoribosyltransferase family protein [Fimbriimonadales bacterium]|nr:phosphoribosyltransferase family protein [Fimbriimonadales bacterium]